VDCSDPAIAQSYADVRSDANPLKWCVLNYASATKLGLQASGTGDFSEFLAQFDDSRAQFGFIRVTTGDSESKRAKFVFVSWVGAGVGALARAKVSVHKAKVKEVFRDYACEIHAEDRSELSEQAVMDKVVKSGGANYGTGSKRE